MELCMFEKVQVINAFGMPLVLWDDSRKRFYHGERKPVPYGSAAAKAGHILGRLQMIQQRIFRCPDCQGQASSSNETAHSRTEVRFLALADSL
jgi:hypothetical protein